MRGLTVRPSALHLPSPPRPNPLARASTPRLTSSSPFSVPRAQQYIADLRACRVRELEEKRINKEMAHIRQKFKGACLDLAPSPSSLAHPLT